MEFMVQSNVEVEIYGVRLVLVNNDEWHEAFPIVFFKDN